jgi:hypothetical protein
MGEMTWYFIGTREDGCVTMKGGFKSSDEVDNYLRHTDKYIDIRKFGVTKDGHIFFTKRGKDKPVH